MKMTKKRMFCILGIALYVTVIVVVVIKFFRPSSSKKDVMSSYPELSYSYIEKINKLKNCELDIDIEVQSPRLNNGYYQKPVYWATMNFNLSNGQLTTGLSKKVINQDNRYNSDIEKEAYDILYLSGIEKEYLENDWIYEMDCVLDYDKYRIAYVHNQKTENHISTEDGESYKTLVEKAHTGIFLIYEISSKRITYLAELTLNENYCFSYSTGYFNINNINISE